jgi:hypothetical protein
MALSFADRPNDKRLDRESTFSHLQDSWLDRQQTDQRYRQLEEPLKAGFGQKAPFEGMLKTKALCHRY